MAARTHTLHELMCFDKAAIAAKVGDRRGVRAWVERAVAEWDCAQHKLTKLCKLQRDAFMWAAANGHTPLVRHWCDACDWCMDSTQTKNGVCHTLPRNAALQVAAQNGHLDVVRFLCELPAAHGVDLSTDHNAALRGAAKAGRLEVVRYLCQLPARRGVEPGGTTTVLLAASANGHTEVVQFL